MTHFKGLPPFAAENVASFGCSLADLLYREGCEMAPFTRWSIQDPSKFETAAVQLCKDIEDYAKPFFRSLSTLEAIIHQLENETRHQAQSGHLAVANALAGNHPKALEALTEYTEADQNQGLPTSEQTLQFVQAFAEHFGFGESLLAR
ncbi:hypothetical protein [Streptomyces syringium]|uniref:hypothetical protein n=1 Tax=Streptomyces syringium TaxID=76729 RepID=UPI0033A8DEFD